MFFIIPLCPANRHFNVISSKLILVFRLFPGLTAVARHHNLMKESRNDVIEETSNNNRGVTFLTPSQLFPTLMNPLALHASFTSNPSLFHHSASPLFHWAQNTSSHVTSSTSIVQTPAPVVTRRRRKKDEVESAPLSPPTSGSSPQSNGSAPDVVSSGKVALDKIDPREKVFTCGICNRSFGYKHVLQNHERTHTGEKPFECPQCHKRFTRDHHLKTHMRLHTGEKPYHCTHCDRHFVQVANLRRHLRVHTGERPYACELCSSKFSDSNQLKAHMLIHKGEKPFECLQCRGRFRRRHHLMHHKCSGKHSEIMDTHYSDSNDEMLIDDEDADDSAALNNNSTMKIRERKSRDIRHVIRYDKVPPPILPVPLVIPEQTEPEDLSMSTRHRHNNNNSNSSAAESHSQSDEDFDELYYRHPKFRKHLQAQPPDP